MPYQVEEICNLIKNKVKRYIFVSTVDVYGYPLSRIPVCETDELVVPNTEYAVNKKACEDLLMGNYNKDGFPVTIVRPSYSLGRRFLITPVSWDAKYAFHRISKGLPVLVPGDGTTLIHPDNAANTGRMIARIAGKMESIGRCYNCARETAMTQDEYMKAIGRVAGKEPILIHIPSDMILEKAKEAFINTPLPILGRFNLAFSVDRFKREFQDFKWTASIEEGISSYMQRIIQNGEYEMLDKQTDEDRIIQAWTENVSHLKIL